MKKKALKILIPFALIFSAVVILAAIARGVSIQRNEGTEGIEIESRPLLRYIWIELKAIFKFSRY